ncbi:MAG TPA: hypothetical protein VEW48_16565 [Thermoanaerobaculia bacterium]|nr:hypothetical protein [Thermoanaerobaculia bacterium]
MTREQYEHRKRRLEEQLQAGIQLLESAYQAQVRALDLVWMLQAEEAGAGAIQAGAPLSSPAAPTAPPPATQEALSVPGQPRRRSPSEVSDDVHAALPLLPEMFTRGDVCKTLGYEPDRAILYRILQDLVQKGRIRLETRGAGQRATVYCRTDPSDPPAPG